MKSLCVWFEIPVDDFDRAKKFYEKVMGLEITEQKLLDTKLGMFPSEGYANSGCISKCENHSPSKDGTLVYLNAKEGLNGVLSRVEPAGGKVLTHKTKISDEYGYMAAFLDTEGNRVALLSKK